MNFLKQFTIFSIVLLVASQGAVAMERAPRKPAPAASQPKQKAKNEAKKQFEDSDSEDEADSEEADSDVEEADSGSSWFTAGRLATLATTGTLALLARAYPGSRTPVIAGLAIAGGGYLTHLLLGGRTDALHDGLDLTPAEMELFCKENDQTVERPEWQTKLFALLKVVYNVDKPEAVEKLKKEVLKTEDPHIILAAKKVFNKIRRKNGLIGFLAVLKAYDTWYISMKKLELEGKLTDKQANLKAALAEIDFENLLTEKNKYSLTLAQEAMIKNAQSVLEIHKKQQEIVEKLIKEAAENKTK